MKSTTVISVHGMNYPFVFRMCSLQYFVGKKANGFVFFMEMHKHTHTHTYTHTHR